MVFNVDRDTVVRIGKGECAIEYRTLKRNKSGLYIDVQRVLRTQMNYIVLQVTIGENVKLA